jgi:hypothetical protein
VMDPKESGSLGGFEPSTGRPSQPDGPRKSGQHPAAHREEHDAVQDDRYHTGPRSPSKSMNGGNNVQTEETGEHKKGTTVSTGSHSCVEPKCS